MAGATGVRTNAQEAWDQGQGVCQDMAHVTVALLRAAGLPARYVSGYLHADPAAEPGQTVVGESHAWVEYWAGSWQPLRSDQRRAGRGAARGGGPGPRLRGHPAAQGHLPRRSGRSGAGDRRGHPAGLMGRTGGVFRSSAPSCPRHLSRTRNSRPAAARRIRRSRCSQPCRLQLREDRWELIPHRMHLRREVPELARARAVRPLPALDRGSIAGRPEQEPGGSDAASAASAATRSPAWLVSTAQTSRNTSPPPSATSASVSAPRSSPRNSARGQNSPTSARAGTGGASRARCATGGPIAGPSCPPGWGCPCRRGPRPSARTSRRPPTRPRRRRG